MKLTIIAATGGIGRLATEQAITAGHDVTAVVRDPTKLSTNVRVVAVDLMSDGAETLTAAFDGADAVLSCLGRRSASDAGITSQGTRTILQGMHSAGVRRIVVISASPIGTVASPGRPSPPRTDPGDGFFVRNLFYPLLKTVLRKPYADLALMEEMLRDSDTDWTAIRPTRLTNKPLTGTYRTAIGRNPRPGLTISRADVAHLMLRVLDQPETINRTIGITHRNRANPHAAAPHRPRSAFRQGEPGWDRP